MYVLIKYFGTYVKNCNLVKTNGPNSEQQQKRIILQCKQKKM